MMHFFYSGWELLLASAVHNMHLCAKTQRRSCSIHSYVAASHDSHLFPSHNRRTGILVKSFHQIASGQIFIGGKYAVCLLSRYSHKFGKSRAGTDKDGGKPLFIQKLVDGNGLTYHYIRLNLHT